MTATIQAIETQYKGYRFRSRIEARWAVFFDALRVRWEYEKEGFDLGVLGWYLPDFWLPDFRCWVEIKGDDPTDEEKQKLSALCNAAKCNGMIVWGDVGNRTYFAHFTWVLESYISNRQIGFQDCGDGVIAVCPKCSRPLTQKISFEVDNDAAIVCTYFCGDHVVKMIAAFGDIISPFYLIGWADNISPLVIACNDETKYTAAVTAARSARFEFGESGVKV